VLLIGIWRGFRGDAQAVLSSAPTQLTNTAQ